MILLQLFGCFLQIGLFSVGGGYAAIPLIQSQVVDLRRWLTQEQFMDLATIAEMTPGPIAVNGATFTGLRIAGLPGAVAATFGCILPSLIIVSLLAYVYRRYRRLEAVQTVLSFLRPAVVALIAAAGLDMLLQAVSGQRFLTQQMTLDPAALCMVVTAFFVLRKFRPGPIPVMLSCGAMGLLLGLAGVF